MTPGRQVVQRVPNHGVVLDFNLMTVFEDQHGLGLVRHRSLVLRTCGSCFSFRPSLRLDRRRIIVGIGARRLSGAAAIEDRGSATVVILVALVPRIFRLILHRIADIGFPYHRVCVRYVDRPSAREELAALMTMVLTPRRARIHRKQRIDTARRLIEEWVPRLNSVGTYRSNTGRHARRGIQMSTKIRRAYRCRGAIDLRGRASGRLPGKAQPEQAPLPWLNSAASHTNHTPVWKPRRSLLNKTLTLLEPTEGNGVCLYFVNLAKL